MMTPHLPLGIMALSYIYISPRILNISNQIQILHIYGVGRHLYQVQYKIFIFFRPIYGTPGKIL